MSKPLTDKQEKNLLMAFVKARKGKSFTEDEFENIYKWANVTVIMSAAFELIMKGEVIIDWNGEEVVFISATAPSLAARKEVDDLLQRL